MFSDKEYSDYEESLRNLWDITNAMNDAEEKGFGKGKKEGIVQGRAEGAKKQAFDIARKMKHRGDDIDYIITITGLTNEEVEKIV